MGSYITTYTGTHFYPLSPDMADIHIEDIAHALSLMTRANGHFPEFYSVAQHCVHCAEEAIARKGSPREVMLCLLHDAAEAYLADVTRPVKDKVQGYRAAEDRILGLVCEKYMGTAPDEREWAYASAVDDALLYHEFYHYMGEYILEPQTLSSSPEFITLPFKAVEERYLEIFREYSAKIQALRDVKMIAVDLDGTLLDDNKQVSERTYNALLKAQEKGIEIVPATGRSFPLIPKFIKDLPAVNYFVTTNGAAVYSKSGECLIRNEMDAEDAAEIAEYMIEELGAFACAFGQGKYIAQPPKGTDLANTDMKELVPPYASNYFNSGNLSFVESVAERLREMGGAEIVTVDLHALSNEQRGAIMERMERYPQLVCVYGSPFNMDITHVSATKGKAVLKLGEFLGADAKEILACGDSGNDADMIRRAGIGAAMRNGDEFAVGAADFVTLSNEEDGVAELIEKYML